MNDWFAAEDYVDRALEFFERGRFADAERELRKALAIDSEQADWHFNLGVTLEAAGRDREALACFSRAAGLLPEEAGPCLSAGIIASRLGDADEAITWLERTIELDPINEHAYASLIENLARVGRHDDAETAYYLAQQTVEESAPCLAAVADSLIERDEYKRALWCLREAVRLVPNMPRVRGQLGRVYAALGQPHRALRLYLRELRDAPGSIETLLDYGDLLAELGRTSEANEKYRRVLELEPAHVEAHMRLGELAMATGRIDQAALELELVLKLSPGYPDARILLGETLLYRGDRDEARRVLVEEVDAHEANEDDGEPVRTGSVGGPGDYQLMNLLLDAELPAEAARFGENLIQRSGESADLLRQLAVAYFRAGKPDRGRAVSRRVLHLEPRCLASIHNLALAACHAGDYRQAWAWIRRGLGIHRADTGLRRLRVYTAAAVVWQRVVSVFR